MEFDDLSDEEKNQVAKGFDATPDLIPFIPYLLQDLWELGSSPKIIIDILKSLNLPAESKVLDLACGKGAVSIQIANELGFRCHGIDLFKPFILEATNKAKEFGLTNLCSFEVESIQTAVETKKNFDVVILASAETLLGNIDQAVESLRKCIMQGGYYIYDGAYLKDKSSLTNPDCKVMRPYDETIHLLTSQGDKLIAEIEIPIMETNEINKRYTSLIKKRTEELLVKYPEKKELLINYVKKQEDECEIIEKEIVGCVWCLQKN
jgi:cyclopropane fatty-acyl-phospholipid synthase-like methyltransferase